MPHIKSDSQVASAGTQSAAHLAPGRKRSHDGRVKSQTNDATNASEATTQSPPSVDSPYAKSKAARVKLVGKDRVARPSNGNRANGNAAGAKGRSPQDDKKQQALLAVRKQLPIWSHAERIRGGLRASSDVMLLVGETGSGKSTQVPQFLLDEAWAKGKCIAITQPRRVAAISLARRVADEMGSHSEVGYSVRFDTSVSAKTRIKFLTEGMLLQEMLRDPSLPQYSAVIVDEVHERSVNVDLILGFLRRLVCKEIGQERKTPLKVVVMSATADVEALFHFFDQGFNGSKGDSNAVAYAATVPDIRTLSAEKLSTDRIFTCLIKGRQHPVKTSYLTAPTTDFVEEALKTIFRIHIREPLPGDILVFLTGQDTVESLQKLVEEYAQALDSDLPKMLVLLLFAALPQHAQQYVFEPPPSMTRKVILATNIAETSITVPGVRFVVDCGKSKMKHFRNRLGLDSLLVKPISQSSAIQRQGRAGREAPGQCHRLYTETEFKSLEKVTQPEILRCDLSAALLTMKARNIANPLDFPFLSPPPRESMEKALLQLLYLGTLNDDGSISPIGQQIARLPLSPTLGRVIIEAASENRQCLPAVIDIVAGLNVENIFLHITTEDTKDEAKTARKELERREGDHLTLLSTIRAYTREHADRKAWCSRRFISRRAMQNVMDIRKQLREQCIQLKLISRTDLIESDEDAEDPGQKDDILQCIVAGFASKTARLMPDGSYRTVLGNQTVAIHPASVLFGRKVEAIVFTEYVYTNKSYARGVSAVQLGWVERVLAPQE